MRFLCAVWAFCVFLCHPFKILKIECAQGGAACQCHHSMISALQGLEQAITRSNLGTFNYVLSNT